MLFSKDKKYFLDILELLGLPTFNRNFWWVKYPKRAAQEIFEMRDNTNSRYFQRGDRLIFQEEIQNNFGTYYFISIETNSDYPFTMPKAFIINPKIDSRFRKHIYKDGTICLMNPNSYNSKVSILEIRNLTAAWCFCYETYINTGIWPAAEHKQ